MRKLPKITLRTIVQTYMLKSQLVLSPERMKLDVSTIAIT